MSGKKRSFNFLTVNEKSLENLENSIWSFTFIIIFHHAMQFHCVYTLQKERKSLKEFLFRQVIPVFQKNVSIEYFQTYSCKRASKACATKPAR